MKQDIRIYVTNSRPNGWTDRAEIFRGQWPVDSGQGVIQAKKKSKLFFFQIIFSNNFFPRPNFP